MSKSDDSESDNTVGYKRPPIATRFKKGTSGNPKGRPKHKKSLAAMFQETLYQTVRVRDGNRARSITKIEALIEVNVNKGLKGDLRAFAKIMEIANKLGIADAFVSEQEKAEIKKAHEETFQYLASLLDQASARGPEIIDEEKKGSQ